jgi:hypothetical protein
MLLVRPASARADEVEFVVETAAPARDLPGIAAIAIEKTVYPLLTPRRYRSRKARPCRGPARQTLAPAAPAASSCGRAAAIDDEITSSTQSRGIAVTTVPDSAPSSSSTGMIAAMHSRHRLQHLHEAQAAGGVTQQCAAEVLVARSVPDLRRPAASRRPM